MKTCQLSRREATEYLRHGKVPDCRLGRHIHISAEQAMELVNDGVAREVAPGRIVREGVWPREWRSKMSGGVKVLQFLTVRSRGRKR